MRLMLTLAIMFSIFVRFAADISELCSDEKICTRINKIVQSIKEELQQLSSPALDDVISSAAKKKDTQSPIGKDLKMIDNSKYNEL